jgi:hypothetical protein
MRLRSQGKSWNNCGEADPGIRTNESATMSDQAWGIIRYIPCQGLFPDEDPCAFDGWYTIKSWAQEVYDNWCRDYPDWIVARPLPVTNDKAVGMPA